MTTPQHEYRTRFDFSRNMQWPELAYEYAIKNGWPVHSDDRGFWAKVDMTWVPLRAPMEVEGPPPAPVTEQFETPHVQAPAVTMESKPDPRLPETTEAAPLVQETEPPPTEGQAEPAAEPETPVRGERHTEVIADEAAEFAKVDEYAHAREAEPVKRPKPKGRTGR